MKLLHQTSIYFLAFSLLMFMIGGVGGYFALRYFLNHEMDESLIHTRSVLHKELSKRDSLPPVLEIMDEIINLQEVSADSDVEIFQDTILNIVEEDEGPEPETFRQYIFVDQIKGKYYRIKLNHSKFGNEHLLLTVLSMGLGFVIILLLSFNFFNLMVSKRIWKPFYHTIDQIKNFNVAKSIGLSMLATQTDEFEILNEELNRMTDKMLKDFQSLKQFAENASHEIQTPLAIIRSQIEMLIQSKQMTADEMAMLSDIQQMAGRLSRLNQSLILLTRIENKQYAQEEMVNIQEVIRQKLNSMDLLIKDKSLKVSSQLESKHIQTNFDLIEILISNLLNNAIKYNLPHGQIQIFLTEKRLVFRNTGMPLTVPTEKLFERFQKNEDSSKSLGLGLAIVRQICEAHNWEIHYENTGKWHSLEIIFN